jgi:hypothetical protein
MKFIKSTMVAVPLLMLSNLALAKDKVAVDFNLDKRSRIELSPAQIREEFEAQNSTEESPHQYPDELKGREGALYYADAPLKIDVYKDPQNLGIKKQFLIAHSNGEVRHVAIVSTGAPGHETPSGIFGIDRRERYWVSTIYNSRMDFAVFFNGGIALHQSPYLRALGGRASHGCTRQSGSDAEITFGLVGAFGNGNTAVRLNSGLGLPDGISKSEVLAGIEESQNRINRELGRI